MRENMVGPHSELSAALATDQMTVGLVIRVHGDHMILAREEPIGPDGELECDDRVRITRIGANTFGLSVKRHTGRWERTPFSGTIEEMVNAIKGTMQHLIAQWY